jgi:hypothetical protein
MRRPLIKALNFNRFYFQEHFLLTKASSAIVCAALCFVSCLIPQDDQVLPDLPARQNTPPRVITQVPEDAAPSIAVVGGCERKPFSVTVDDADVGDSIRSVWLIDPPGVNAPILLGGDATQSATSPRIRTAVEPPGLTREFLRLSDGQRHQLLVYVTDGTFNDAKNPNDVSPGAFTDRAIWFFEVSACP